MKYPELAEAFASLSEAVARGYMTEEEEAKQIERLKRDLVQTRQNQLQEK